MSWILAAQLAGGLFKKGVALGTPMNALWGMLVVNKPANMSSKDVSRWLGKRLGKIQMGHVGTLDPMAEGVLPILLGKATRLQDYLLNSTKVYEFDVQFGEETDTLDRTGKVVFEKEFDHINDETLGNICRRIHGNWQQETPVYSAVKYKGQALYHYARKGRSGDIPEEVLKRDVFINEVKLLKYDSGDGIGSFRVSCSAGTYVRALAKEIALKAESRCHVIRLVRLESCGVGLESGYTLDELEPKIHNLEELIVPVEKMKLNLPRFRLKDSEQQKRLLTGQNLFFKTIDFDADSLKNVIDAVTALLLDAEGQLFALGNVQVVSDGFTIHMKRMLI